MKALLWLASATMMWAGSEDTFLLRGVTVYPVSAPKAENVSLLVRDGRIAEIGPKIAVPKGMRVIEGKGLHVYPGMIDSATSVGLSEIGSVRETVDTAEIGDFKPQLRASIAINASSEHIPVIRSNGVTTAMTMPEGGIIAGQASLVRLDGWTWEEMELKRGAAMVLRFPAIVTQPFGPRQQSFDEVRRAYESRLKQLDDYLESARRYQKAKTAGATPDLAMEAMLPVIDGKQPLMVTAVRERAIRAAIEWAGRQKVKIILAEIRKPGAALELIKSRRIPVILGPTQELPLDGDDPYDAAFTLPAELQTQGIKFAFGSFGNQFSRNLPYQAATAVAFGLPYEDALKSVTLNAAEIWGVDAEIGSIDVGKWADLMVTDGDPLEVRTQVKRLFIKGKEVDLESRHTRLYRKYLARP